MIYLPSGPDKAASITWLFEISFSLIPDGPLFLGSPWVTTLIQKFKFDY